MKHAELPWFFDGEGILSKTKEAPYNDNYIVFEFDEFEEDKYNAEFIVKACNNYYEMVECLKNLKLVVNNIDQFKLAEVSDMITELLGKVTP